MERGGRRRVSGAVVGVERRSRKAVVVRHSGLERDQNMFDLPGVDPELVPWKMSTVVPVLWGHVPFSKVLGQSGPGSSADRMILVFSHGNLLSAAFCFHPPPRNSGQV